MSTLPATAKYTLSCPSCGHAIACYDGDSSSHFSCVQCGTFFKASAGGSMEVVKRFLPGEVVIPLLPPGMRGTIKDRTYTVVGFIKKRDNNEKVEWIEYLLHAPRQSHYTVLAEFNGSFILIGKTSFDKYELFNTGYANNPVYEIRHKTNNRRFRHYLTYKFEIPWAGGEFDWNIIDDENSLLVEEYLDPPNMIVAEISKGTTDWYWARHVERKEILQAFGLDIKDLPAKKGKGALELPSFYTDAVPLTRFTVLALGLLVLAQMLTSFFKPAEYAFSSSYTTTADSANASALHTIVTEPFKLSRSGGVEVELLTDANNEWIELGVTMVNEQTGRTFEFTKVIESYGGYEGGEAWSEGSNNETANLSSVPAGTYHINISPYTDSKRQFNIGVRVEQNTVFYSNIFWMMAILLVYPIVQSVRRNNHEQSLFS